MSECPICHTEEAFLLRDGRYSCRVCNYEDQRRVEYEMDDECNFIDFTKSNTRMMTELRKSVKKSRLRKAGKGGKREWEKIPDDLKIPLPPVSMMEKQFRRRVQPGERDPPGDVMPRRHFEVATWTRVTHRLSTFTQLLARTTRFLVKEKRAKEEVKPIAMMIFRRLLASQDIAFTAAEWTDVAEDQYVLVQKSFKTRKQVVATARDQRAEMASQRAARNEELQTGVAAGEDGMWSMLMSDKVTEQLQVAEEGEETEQLKTIRKKVRTPFVRRTETTTSKDAMVRAGILTLNVELLVAISYLACAVVRSEVQMADLIRWYREARIPLPPQFLHDLTKIKYYDDGKMGQLETCGYEKHFNFYLYECTSFLQRVIAAARVPRRAISIRLDEIVARHLHSLNLPFALMERALVLMQKARVETDEMTVERAMEEGRYCNETTCRFGLAKGRMHPMLSTAYRAPFITFSSDTRALAVVLLVLRMTLAMGDDAVFGAKSSSSSTRFFSLAAWLRQFRARLRIYAGDDPDTVVNEGMREQPRDYDVPWTIQMNRADLILWRGKLQYHQGQRAAFPANWTPLPRLDGGRFMFKDTLPFPADGEATRAPRGRVAMMDPLIYHGDAARERLEKEEEERAEGEKRGREWREAVRAVGRSYEDAPIEETSDRLVPPSPAMRRMKRREEEEEGGEEERNEMNEECRHLFPAAVNLEVPPLPQFSVSSLLKLNNRVHDTYIIGGGVSDIVFAYQHAAPSLSRTHRFLVHHFSRLITEAPCVLFAAETLLQRRLMSYESCLSTVQRLESGDFMKVAGCGVDKGRKEYVQEETIEIRRAVGEARNIVEISRAVPRKAARNQKRLEKEEQKKRDQELIDLVSSSSEDEEQLKEAERQDQVGESSGEKKTDEGGRMEEVSSGVVPEEAASVYDDSEREEEQEEEEEAGDDDDDDDEVVALEEEEKEKRPCERYDRTRDFYRPMVQKTYYLSYDFLWSILAMRMW